jgi:glycosyltransferase involved in cell wall biosynthesis
MNKTDPELSVIIPVFNVEQYISSCLDSVLSQSLSDIEIICIDDGSTDGSGSILSNYARHDSRIIVIEQENQGAGVARNAGIKESRGKYLVFMDPDDWYPNEKTLEVLLREIKKSGLYVCGGSLDFYDSEKRTIIPNKINKAIFKENKEVKFSNYQYDYFFQRYIYNADFLKSNNILFPDLIRYQDVIFFLRVMEKAKSFYSISEITYVYRGNNHSNTFFSREKVMSWLQGMNQALVISKKNHWYGIHYKTAKQLTYDNYLDSTFELRYSNDSEYNNLFNSTLEEINCNYLQKIDYHIDKYYVCYGIKYLGFVYDLLNNNTIVCKTVIDNFIKNEGVVEAVKAITYNCLGKSEDALQIADLLERKKNPRKIKTIGIFNETLNVGGVERCISLMIPTLQNMGYKIVLITETPKSNDKFPINANVKRIQLPGLDQNDRTQWVDRVDALINAIVENNIDAIYYNSYWKENIIFDMLTINKIAKRPIILHHHNVFSAMLARNNNFFYRASTYYSYADCLIVLSSVDQLYFRSKGIPSIYIPNPTNYLKQIKCERIPNKIIWVGRFVPNHKQPIEALKIINEIVKTHPNVILYMIGDGEQSVKNELTQYVGENNLTKNVIFTGFLKEMEKEYASASLMIMTSCIEGFPMVVAECKCQGLPLVSYDLPYVEMIRDSAGVVRVKQGDYKTAAVEVCKILDNEELHEKMSKCGINSLKNYSDEIIQDKWIQLIEAVETASYSSYMTLENYEDISTLVDTLIYHTTINRGQKKNLQKQMAMEISISNVYHWLLKKIVKKKVKKVGKYEEMICSGWYDIDNYKLSKDDLILNAGIGARIRHNLKLNNIEAKYHLPLDQFGDYDLESIIKMFYVGPDSLFENYEILEAGKTHFVVYDSINKMLSRNNFAVGEDFEIQRKKLIEQEIVVINNIKNVLSSVDSCSIIMCNRKNMDEITNFGKELEKIFNNLKINIYVIYNYPELSNNVLIRTSRDSTNLKVFSIAMNDQSADGWSGNTQNWNQLLRGLMKD